MKVFIDLGAHMFGGLLEFTEKLKIDKEWIVYSYEGNKDVFEQSATKRSEIENNYKKLNHINAAVLDYNGTVVFNKQIGATISNVYNPNYTTGSNCLIENPKVDLGNGAVFNIVQEEVKCIDINTLLDTVLQEVENPEIYIKCDIEGSEFKVLPKLLTHPSIAYLKEIHVEWHERFWLQDQNEFMVKCFTRKMIVDKLNSLNIPNYVHH